MAILRGTVDALVLKALSFAPMHAYEVASWVEARSGGELMIEDAALMQALHRLEARGLLDATWGITANERRARYYRLTTAGRARLRDETKQLTAFTNALMTVLRASSAHG